MSERVGNTYEIHSAGNEEEKILTKPKENLKAISGYASADKLKRIKRIEVKVGPLGVAVDLADKAQEVEM